MRFSIASGQCGQNVSPCCGWIVFSAAVAVVTAALFCAPALYATTGSIDEISNIHVENVTQTTVDVVWDTIHPSTSQVVISRDLNYAAERWAPVQPDSNLVNHHRVTVDNLVPFNSRTMDGNYYYYVASADANDNLYTNPGPSDPTGTLNVPPLLNFTTLPTDIAGPVSYSVWAYGGTHVYAGYDLYLQVMNILKSGPLGNLYIIYSDTKDGNHDGIVKDSNNNVVTSIEVHFECVNYDPLGDDSQDQANGTPYNFCWGRNNNISDTNVRLRTTEDTPPGNYTATVTLSPDGTLEHAASFTYAFTVLDPPEMQATPPHRNAPPIPNLSTWETQMTTLGGHWCDGTNGSSRDSQNAVGNFLSGWGWYADAWNYDGGRVYEQIDTYTAAHGAANHARWQHCAVTILDPYRQWILANNAALQAPSIFPYGMAMNYWRTGDETNRQAVDYLATHDPFWPYSGYVDPYWVRETAYQIDVWVASEMMGHDRSPLVSRAVDKLVGQMDQFTNQRLWMYPFMTGIAMEALINWYEMNLEEGNPDNRIPYVIKGVLDKLWSQNWLPDGYSLLWDPYNIPNLDNFTELNDLVAPAYAWYWYRTADDTYLERGDLLFAHTFDNPGAYTWSGKQFSVIYKWSFDYVTWRSFSGGFWGRGSAPSAVVEASNPYTGPYADTEPPIELNVTATDITSNSATIIWTTYENADSQVWYGTTNAYGYSTSTYDTGSNQKKTHSVPLSNLKNNTVYHFQVRSHDASNNLAASSDYIFTTLP